MSLPHLPYTAGHSKGGQITFGGLNHNLYASDGEIWDMQNMTGNYFPLLSPRSPRYNTGSIAKPNSFLANDGLYWVDGTTLYRDGVATTLTNLTDDKKCMTVLGDYIVIWPDKKYYRKSTGESGTLYASVFYSNVEIKEDGTYKGEEAKFNTLAITEGSWSANFKVGDAVKLGLTSEYLPNPDSPVIIREISDDGKELRFYENTFLKALMTSSLSVARDVPELDFICENENRLWGCKGDTIYASKLGDPFNWNVFDGIASDSYAVDVGSAGDFTACCSYLGYPCFFKENHIYKVYGDRPSNFQVMSSASLGVEAGSDKSLAIAGEILFYLSRAGIMAYSGGIPQSVSAPLGVGRFKNAVGGSDGVKYYVSMQNAQGVWAMYVYDTRTQLWHKEDNAQVYGFAWHQALYFIGTDGTLWLDGGARDIPEGAAAEDSVESFVEFGDFIENSPNAKHISKLQLRIEVDEGAGVEVHIRYDSEGDWHLVGTALGTSAKRSYYLPVIPHRVDHFRLKITGRGNYKIYSLTREYAGSSELKTTAR